MKSALCLLFLMLSLSTRLWAGDVQIVQAELTRIEPGQWAVNVTLKHADEGWDHYADRWQVIDGEGRVLGDRILHHPHVNEQPFTRGLSRVVIPTNTHVVYIRAHDSRHGWAKQRLLVDLTQVRGDNLLVKSP